MKTGLGRLAVLAVVLAAAVFVFQPQMRQIFYSATTPRTVEARGSLSDLERATIELFERVSPSVVQVVNTPNGAGVVSLEGGGLARD